MRRIFFTQEMKDAIVAGKKTMTTRDHQKELGDWEACTGNWHKPSNIKRFATINIVSNDSTTWGRQLERFKGEGFESVDAMLDFAHRTGLERYSHAPNLYCHIFTTALDAAASEGS